MALIVITLQDIDNDVDVRVLSDPPFPGEEAELSSAQFLGCLALTAIAPEEEPDDPDE